MKTVDFHKIKYGDKIRVQAWCKNIYVEFSHFDTRVYNKIWVMDDGVKKFYTVNGTSWEYYEPEPIPPLPDFCSKWLWDTVRKKHRPLLAHNPHSVEYKYQISSKWYSEKVFKKRFIIIDNHQEEK